MTLSPSDPHLLAITEYYGDRRAARSDVPYIQHIHEGLIVMDRIGATERSMQAYCLHPLVQSDLELIDFLRDYPNRQAFDAHGCGTNQLVLAIEYRRSANSYLSHDQPHDYTPSPLPEVAAMLVADKVQNRKDFERYHAATHPRHAELTAYFRTWITILGVSEGAYQAHVAAILTVHPWPASV